MTQPLIFDLGEVQLPDGYTVKCAAHITIDLHIENISPSVAGCFFEDHLKPVLRKLLARLGDPQAWQDAFNAGSHADGDDDDDRAA